MNDCMTGSVDEENDTRASRCSERHGTRSSQVGTMKTGVLAQVVRCRADRLDHLHPELPGNSCEAVEFPEGLNLALFGCCFGHLAVTPSCLPRGSTRCESA